MNERVQISNLVHKITFSVKTPSFKANRRAVIRGMQFKKEHDDLSNLPPREENQLSPISPNGVEPHQNLEKK